MKTETGPDINVGGGRYLHIDTSVPPHLKILNILSHYSSLITSFVAAEVSEVLYN
jgi:hypothetical protein